MSIIWEAKLDNQYTCRVNQVDQSNGTLTVIDENENKMLLCEPVTLSYGALFGPDVADIAEWEDRCIRAVDAVLA